MSKARSFKNGTWYELRKAETGTFYIYWSEDRRSKRVSTRQKTLAAANAFFEEWLRLVGTEAKAGVLTCADLWDLKYGDVGERSEHVWKNLSVAFGDKVPAELSQADMDRYMRDRALGKIGRKAAAGSTMRLEMSMLRASWNHAVKKRIISEADLPVLDPLPDPSPPRERWLRDDEAERLFAAAEELRNGPHLSRIERFLWLALETGARRTAIQELRWPQVDFETGVIHYLPEGRAQSRKRRASVPISAVLRPVLERAYEERTNDLVLGFASRVNDPLKAVAAHAKVKGVTPHVLRHTAATRMARAGVPLWLIAKVLGNTIEQVEKVYAKHSPEMLVDAVNAISGTRRKSSESAQDARGQRPTSTYSAQL